MAQVGPARDTRGSGAAPAPLRAADSPATDTAAADARPGWRRWAGLALLIAALAALAIWLVDRLAHVVVTDARVAASMHLLSSRVPGLVAAVVADEGTEVRAGDVLVRIDATEAGHRLAELQAERNLLDARIRRAAEELGMVERRTASQTSLWQARVQAAQSRQAGAASELDRASADWDRAGPLRERGILTQQEWESLRSTWQQAAEAHNEASADLASARAGLADAEAAAGEADVLRRDLDVLEGERPLLEARVRQQQSRVDDHVIRSPIDGVVDETFIHAGEFVAPGQRMLVMHNPADVWVSANIKETDLRHLGQGDPVRISVDAFPGLDLTARVSRVDRAATSQFALLPNPNPAGNFTKITQRVEVRLDLDDPPPGLAPGMMAEVTIPKRAVRDPVGVP